MVVLMKRPGLKRKRCPRCGCYGLGELRMFGDPVRNRRVCSECGGITDGKGRPLFLGKRVVH